MLKMDEMKLFCLPKNERVYGKNTFGGTYRSVSFKTYLLCATLRKKQTHGVSLRPEIAQIAGPWRFLLKIRPEDYCHDQRIAEGTNDRDTTASAKVSSFRRNCWWEGSLVGPRLPFNWKRSIRIFKGIVRSGFWRYKEAISQLVDKHRYLETGKVVVRGPLHCGFPFGFPLNFTKTERPITLAGSPQKNTQSVGFRQNASPNCL